MAIIKCKECQKDVSTTAATCPSCGAKVPKQTKVLTWVAGGIAAFIVVSCINGTQKSDAERQIAQNKKTAVEAAKSPAQRASEAAKAKHDEREFQFGVMAAKLVKSSLKNPASFEFVSAGVVDNGALCLTYRATNSFNAVITENTAITRKFQKGDWNKDCAGHTTVVMNYIRQALN